MGLKDKLGSSAEGQSVAGLQLDRRHGGWYGFAVDARAILTAEVAKPQGLSLRLKLEDGVLLLHASSLRRNNKFFSNCDNS